MTHIKKPTNNLERVQTVIELTDEIEAILLQFSITKKEKENPQNRTFSSDLSIYGINLST